VASADSTRKAVPGGTVAFAFIPVIIRLAGRPTAVIAGAVVRSGSTGLLPTGEFLRASAKARSWETAERKARPIEANTDPLRQSPPEDGLRITFKDAEDAFLWDEEARQLAKTTTCQSRTLFEQQLLT
jgi:hypothetical protein